MTKRAFNKIAAGLNEAISIVRGDEAPARLHLPTELDVKSISKKTGLSQENFASSFGFTVEQIKSWKQGRSRPLGGVRAYLMMIDLDRKGVARILGAARKEKAA
ncbi:MAG: transcriptional regulator [Methylocystis sp.]|uniref:transcriptional regulator n=1 Tax=Methylocystis sp. TaxID=1911079 RepID=UPI003DA6AF12